MEIFEGDVFTAFDAFKMRSLFQNDSVFPHFKSVVVVVMVVVWTVPLWRGHALIDSLEHIRFQKLPHPSSSPPLVSVSACFFVRLPLMH